MTDSTPIGPSVLRRFGITTLEQDVTRCLVTAHMPVGGLSNPFTGQASVAALIMLVDDLGGRVNHYRRGAGMWTVSSELSVEMFPGAIESLRGRPDEPVVAAARPFGPTGATSLSVCSLTHCGQVIGGGTVRALPLPVAPGDLVRRADDPLFRTDQTTLADLMAVEALPVDGGTYRLRQRHDPMVNNSVGTMHGGVSSAGLELVAAAAFNHQQDTPLRTASIRVNFMRPFVAGAQSVYEAQALRIGRTSAVADAAAIGPDGKTAILARVTGYR
jgi:uncharacterized protein (TIGR00369 family)